jgi:S-adenosylmethionine decarboxylase
VTIPVTHFGEHVTYDGYGADPARLDDRSAVVAALLDLVDLVGMKILAGPEVYFAPGSGNKDPGGWTGMVILHESHVSLHTFPARGFLSADVYTCQNGLDAVAIEAFFTRRFEALGAEVNLLQRGTRYPAHDLHPDWVRQPAPVADKGPVGDGRP